MSVELINDFRLRIRNGEDIPPEDLARAILALRSSRTTASIAKAEAKAKAAPLDINALFAPKSDTP